jgi:hypothetical protein
MSITMFLITAVVFTILGVLWGIKLVNNVVPEAVIYILIKEKYIKVKHTDDDLEIVKYYE